MEQAFRIIRTQVKRCKKTIIKRSAMKSKARTKVPFGLLVDFAGRVKRVPRPTSFDPGKKEAFRVLTSSFQGGVPTWRSMTEILLRRNVS